MSSVPALAGRRYPSVARRRQLLAEDAVSDAPQQPPKEDVARFLEAWLSLNIAEALRERAPRPTDEEHAAVRRVVVWLESIAMEHPTLAQLRAYDLMVEDMATKLYPLPPLDAPREIAP